MSNRYPPGGFDYDNHKELVAALAALRAKNAELETRVKELQEENHKFKELLIWARDVFDNENKLAVEITSYLCPKAPPPAEQPPSEPREEKE